MMLIGTGDGQSQGSSSVPGVACERQAFAGVLPFTLDDRRDEGRKPRRFPTSYAENLWVHEIEAPSSAVSKDPGCQDFFQMTSAMAIICNTIAHIGVLI